MANDGHHHVKLLEYFLKLSCYRVLIGLVARAFLSLKSSARSSSITPNSVRIRLCELTTLAALTFALVVTQVQSAPAFSAEIADG